MLDKEIYSYLNTLDNLKALLKAKQRGISTDGQKNWCYKDGSNQLHVGADQKYWNGSAWVYASNEFGPTTLYGNLALGTNTISGDGTPNKGIGVGETGITAVTATAYANGDTRTVLRLYDDTAFEEGDGAGINLYGKTSGSGSYANFGGIKASKENATDGNNAASIYIQSKKHGSNPANALRLDSDQNGYIKSKLMVGSLTETPENQLVVYKDANESVFLSVGNSVTGQNGVRIGFDNISGAGAFYESNYGAGGHAFRCETGTPNVYKNVMSLYLQYYSEYGYRGKVRVYGDLQVDNDITVDGNLTTNFIITKNSGPLSHSLYIHSGSDNIALFSEYNGSKKLAVFGEIQCDTFRLDQTPIVGTITPDKYITIKCNGTNYKIPVVAEPGGL